MAETKTDTPVQTTEQAEPTEAAQPANDDLAEKHSTSSIWLSLIILSIISAGSLSYVYYTISYEKYLDRKGEEKTTVLELVSAFVSTYSGHRTAQTNIDLPVPASFRASALKTFDDKRDLANNVTVQMVGLPGLSIKTAPFDEHLVSVLDSMSKAADFSIWKNIIGGRGEEVFRTIKPVKASKQSCVSCHNEIQSPGKVWKLGDVMGAYVLDVPASGFLESLRLETGLLAFAVIGFGLLGGGILVGQQNRITNVQARMQHESERGEILTQARKKAQDEAKSLSAKLIVSNEELETALAKEKDLNELQRQFVSMASHEFRTPLAIIDGAMHRLKRKIDSGRLTPEDALKRIDRTRTAVKRMTRLMESTLTAARMEEGKVAVTIGPCDIGDIVQDVCAHQQEIAHSHNITCRLSGLPATIQADAGSLEQMLTNLLSNAVKYAPDAPEVEVVAFPMGDNVVIAVQDHGLGIEAEELDKIGVRYFRGTTSTGIAGTGIGLNLTKMLVEMHGGSFKVTSQVGEGSTFVISLPIAGPDQTELAEKLVA